MFPPLELSVGILRFFDGRPGRWVERPSRLRLGCSGPGRLPHGHLPCVRFGGARARSARGGALQPVADREVVQRPPGALRPHLDSHPRAGVARRLARGPVIGPGPSTGPDLGLGDQAAPAGALVGAFSPRARSAERGHGSQPRHLGDQQGDCQERPSSALGPQEAPWLSFAFST